MASTHKYFISKRSIGKRHYIEITQDQFKEAKLAKESLLRVLSIEEKLNLVLENYIEYESELLTLTLRRATFSDMAWSPFQDDIHTINRRLMNLLATCRLYLHQTLQDVSSIYGHSSFQYKEVQDKKLQEKSASLPGYRIMEELRDYIQHRGLLVGYLGYPSARDMNQSDAYWKHKILPRLNVAKLKDEKDRQFDRAILQELEHIADENFVDIIPLVRQYIDSIGRIHIFIREMLTRDIVRWDITIRRIQEIYQGETAEKNLGLALFEYSDSDQVVAVIDIFDDLIVRREALCQKNQQLTKFNSRFVTSEA